MDKMMQEAIDAFAEAVGTNLVSVEHNRFSCDHVITFNFENKSISLFANEFGFWVGELATHELWKNDEHRYAVNVDGQYHIEIGMPGDCKIVEPNLDRKTNWRRVCGDDSVAERIISLPLFDDIVSQK